MRFARVFLTGPLVLLLLMAAHPAAGQELPAELETAELAPPERLPVPCYEEPPANAVVDAHQPPAVPGPVAPYPVIVNRWVQHFVDLFQAPSRREIVSLWLNRSGRYLDMIREVFTKHGLPVELAYMAMIESGFNPAAVSRAGAKGLWQFMEHTARRYGLRVDRWVDERLDPEKSTVAAALYLRDLFAQFGSWFLAKAAYNAGETKVSRAVQRSQTEDFWVLTRGRILREETKRFVPAVVAATLIAQDPERYGFEVTPEPPLAYDVVMMPSVFKLKHLATRAQLPLEDLRRLNPELRRGVTPPGGPYPLKVPAGRGALAERVLEELKALMEKSVVHVVKSGETLGRIAKRYGVSVAQLVSWNGLRDASRIFPGNRLRVAVAR